MVPSSVGRESCCLDSLSVSEIFSVNVSTFDSSAFGVSIFESSDTFCSSF